MFILEPAAKAAQVLHQEYEQGQAEEAREQAGRLAGTLERAEAALLRLQTKLSAKARRRSADPGLAELVREALPPFKKQLNALDRQVHTDFDAVETHLRGKNLPPEIIRRHREAVAAYDREMQTLQGNLDNIAGIAEKAPQNIQKLQGAVDQALEHLQPLQTQGGHAPFDPEQLPFSIPKGEVRPPLETGGILRASKRPGAPGPDYLTATEDIQITPEIKALAQELQHHPVKLYNWTVNNIRFVPSRGSIQGSRMTLETKSGNAFDTASFLAALLRTSGIPTRYRYGTVRIPIEKVMNWAGGAKAPEAAV